MAVRGRIRGGGSSAWNATREGSAPSKWVRHRHAAHAARPPVVKVTMASDRPTERRHRAPSVLSGRLGGHRPSGRGGPLIGRSFSRPRTASSHEECPVSDTSPSLGRYVRVDAGSSTGITVEQGKYYLGPLPNTLRLNAIE